MSFRALSVDARLMPGEQNSSAEVQRAWSATISVLISSSFSFFFFSLSVLTVYQPNLGEQRGSKSGAGQVANA